MSDPEVGGSLAAISAKCPKDHLFLYNSLDPTTSYEVPKSV